MVRVLVFIATLLSFGVGVLGAVSIRSDIQVIIAVVGFAAGFVLLGIGAVLGRLDRHWNFLIEIEEQLRARD